MRRTVGFAVVLSLLTVVSLVALAGPVAGGPATATPGGSEPVLDEAGRSAPGAAGGSATGGAGELTTNTLVVDDDGGAAYTSIETATEDAVDGDTVEVRPGTYTEEVTVTANITLVAPDGATLDGSSLGGPNRLTDGILIAGNTSPTVEGFSITGYGTGVTVTSDSAWTLRDVTIRNSSSDAVRARGVRGDWRIEDSTIVDNAGRGVVVDESTGDWVIGNATIRDNDAAPSLNSARGAGVDAGESTGNWTIRDSTISAHTDGGGIGVTAPGTTGDWTIENTVIENNKDGVRAFDSSGAWSVTGSTVSGHAAQRNGNPTGNGVDAQRATGDWSIRDTRFDGNYIGVQATDSEGAWRIRNANLSNNSVGVWAWDTSGAWTVHGSVIMNNSNLGITADRANPRGNATGNWWGQASGAKPGQCVGNVTCSKALSSPPVTRIDECTVIDESGQYRVITDLSSDSTCIDIRASDVSVDGGGYTLQGLDPSTDKTAVYANGTDGGLRNVTVTDVVVRGWTHSGGSAHSVEFDSVAEGRVADVVIEGGDYGVHLRNASRNEVSNVSINGTANGQPAVALERGSANNSVTDVSIRNTGSGGVRLRSSPNNTIARTEIRYVGASGMQVRSGSGGTTVTDTTVRDTCCLAPGITVDTSNPDLVFENITVVGTDWNGLSLEQSGSEFLVANSTFRGNEKYGVRIGQLNNAVVRNNTVRGNDNHGIYVGPDVDNATVTGNDVRRNDRWGIYVWETTNSTVSHNQVSNHDQGGIILDGASSNVFVNNSVVNRPQFPASTITFPTGIQFTGATDNELRRNTVLNGYRGIDINTSSNDNTLVDNAVYVDVAATWALTISDSTGTTVDSLDIGDSSAANTTLSLTGRNVSVAPNTSAPANSNAQSIGRYVRVRRAGGVASLNLTLRYESGDLGSVPASSLGLWIDDRSRPGWSRLSGSTVNAAARTLGVNLSTAGAGPFPQESIVGAFGSDGGTSGTATPSTATPTPGTGSSPTLTPTRTPGAGASPTLTPTRTPGAGPAPTPTATPPGTGTSGGSGPGFGVFVAVLAVVLAALGRRRRSA